MVAVTVPDLVLCFESLGGGGALHDSWGFGCEFGFVQREYGQEPIGLLRWASIAPEDLIRVLNSNFATVGKLEHTVITENQHFQDWGCSDLLFNIRIDHTGLLRSKVSKSEAHRVMCKRLVFMARKLVADLKLGEKIFVYRVIDRAIDEETILQLGDAVNHYGDNILLFVVLADGFHPPFSVRMLRPGVMIGYIDFFRVAGGKFLEWNHHGWVKLCYNVHSFAQRKERASGFPITPKV